MSEQEKIEAEPKKSIYTLDFDLMLRRADGERFRTKGELLDELNSLLARAEKVEEERDELKTVISNQNDLLRQMYLALDAAYAETHHPNIGAAKRKPMMLHERVKWLAKSRDDWKRFARENEARAEKAEAALESAQKMADHWEVKAQERQQQVNEFWAIAKKARDEWRQLADDAKCNLKQHNEIAGPINWQRVRIDAAIAAMQGMLACRGGGDATMRSETATEYADALVAELKKEVTE